MRGIITDLFGAFLLCLGIIFLIGTLGIEKRDFTFTGSLDNDNTIIKFIFFCIWMYIFYFIRKKKKEKGIK